MEESLGNINAPPENPHAEDQVTLDLAGSVEVIALDDHENVGEIVEIQDLGPEDSTSDSNTEHRSRSPGQIPGSARLAARCGSLNTTDPSYSMVNPGTGVGREGGGGEVTLDVSTPIDSRCLDVMPTIESLGILPILELSSVNEVFRGEKKSVGAESPSLEKRREEVLLSSDDERTSDQAADPKRKVTVAASTSTTTLFGLRPVTRSANVPQPYPCTYRTYLPAGPPTRAENKRLVSKERNSRRREKRKRENQVEAGLGALNIDPQPEQAGGEVPNVPELGEVVAKKSKLATSPAAGQLAAWLNHISIDYEAARANNFSFLLPQSSLFREAPLSVGILRQWAHVLQPVSEGITGVNINPSGSFRDGAGLLTLELDATETQVRRVSVPVGERRSGDPSGQPIFFSSHLEEMARRILLGRANYSCSTCLSQHWPLDKTLFVLVSASEVIAGCSSAESLTMPGDTPVQPIPRVAAQEHFDMCWILGGLNSAPDQVLKSIYGNYQGRIVFLMDLGTHAVNSGVSAKSVMDQMHSLTRYLRQSMRNPNRGQTQVFFLPPIIHYGEEDLALHQGPVQRTSKASHTQLTELRNRVDYRNHMILDSPRTPLAAWGNLASTVTVVENNDVRMRLVERYSVGAGPAAMVGADHTLHLKPEAIHTAVRSLVGYTASCPGAVTW